MTAVTEQLSKKQVNLERIKRLSFAHLKGQKVYICPRCKKRVPYKSHHCPFCGERYHFAIKVPLRLLKNVRNGIATKELHDYVHIYLFPQLDIFDQHYLDQYFTILLVSQGTNGYAQGTASAASGTLPVNLQQAPVNGNTLILIYVGCSDGANSYVSSISQTGVTWQSSAVVVDSDYQDVEIWYGKVGASAGTAISVVYTGASGGDYVEIADVCEFSGLASSPVDKTASSSGGGDSTTTSTGTTGTTTQNAELVIGATSAGGPTSCTQSSPTNSFTLLDGANVLKGSVYGSLGYLYKIVSAEATYSTGTTLANSNGWDGCIATFFAAASTSINVSDSGSGSDAVAVTANVPTTDSGSGSDTVAVTAKMTQTDSGSGSDMISALQANVPVSDAGLGSDVLTSVNVQVPISDVGLGSDALSSLQAQIPVADAGLGSDALSSLKAQIPVSDAVLGTDTTSLQAQVPLADSGLGTDNLVLGSPVNLSDSGFGFDSLLAYSLAGALVGYWAFEEGLGTTVHDMSGNGNNGTLEGSPLPNWVAGRFQYALQFAAADSQFVSLSSQTNFPSGAGARTVSAWVYLTSYSSGNEGVFTYGADTTNEFFSMSISAAGLIYLNVVGSNNTFFTSLTVPLNTWAFIAIVYDGTTNITGYVITASGIQSQALTIGSALSTTISGGSANIGLNQNTGIYFTGVIGEVRLYNVALSAAQVSALYNLSPLSITAQIPLSDSGSGADFVGSLQVKIPLSDAGEGSDSLIIAFPISVSDSVVGTDTAIVIVRGALPTHAIIIQSEKGTVTLQSEKGTVTLQSDSD